MALSDSRTEKLLKDELFMFFDVQHSGVDIEIDKIMEICVMVSDKNFEKLDLGPTTVIKVDDELLENMHKIYKDHHRASGLVDACKKSKETLQTAENKIVEFLNRSAEKNKITLAAISVPGLRFLERDMPKVMNCFQNKNIALSTVREICRIWYPKEYSDYRSSKIGQRALDNVKEYVNEMRYYKASIFKKN